MTTWTVQAAPFNGPDDAEGSMTWVDISAYVNDNLQPIASTSGRQTDLDQVNPGTLSLTLNNQDDRFTPGNVTSPYYPGWRTAMRIRVLESIGARTFTIFDGNMLQPEVLVQTTGLDQTVAVSAVDRIGRLGSARKFISTLTEHIRHAGGSELRGYWPLNDPADALQAREVSQTGAAPLGELVRISGETPVSSEQMLKFAAISPPPGDDVNVVQLNAVLDTGGGVLVSPRLYSSAFSTLLTGNTYVTLAGWFNLNDTNTGLETVLALGDSVFNSFSIFYAPPPNQGWSATAFTVANGGYDVGGPPPRFGSWDFVALRVNLATQAAELWVNETVSSAASVVGVVTGTADTLTVDTGAPGQGVAHVQVYTGSTFDHAAFLAQFRAGFTGLYGQFAGERISTLASYAGIAAADVSADQGTAVMQAAHLAGKTPLSAMQEAADTDRGLLHAAGRRLIFHSRKRRYDL